MLVWFGIALLARALRLHGRVRARKRHVQRRQREDRTGISPAE
jgi:hypothetical protein